MNKFLLIAALLVGAAGAAQVQAQGAPGSTGPAPTAVPLDGGAGLLLASGVAYGLRRLQKRRAR